MRRSNERETWYLIVVFSRKTKINFRRRPTPMKDRTDLPQGDEVNLSRSSYRIKLFLEHGRSLLERFLRTRSQGSQGEILSQELLLIANSLTPNIIISASSSSDQVEDASGIVVPV